MTRLEAQQKVKYYYDKWQEYQSVLDKMDAVFDIQDFNKPFRKYSIEELQRLLNVSEKAYDYSRENQDSNIYDYNLMALKEDKITLAR